MNFHPLPNYIIVKINKEDQSKRKDKIGSLYLHFQEVYMQRNMQNGEIVAIGEESKNIFPKAKEGDTVLFHHFVEGDADKSNLLFSDDTFNYYFVTTSDINGHRNETYGIFDGNNIIPHPDFVFIKKEEKKDVESEEDYVEQNTTQVGSLILFTNWTESREDKEAKASQLMTEIKNQSKGKNMSDSTKRALNIKQAEAEQITANLNHKEYKPFEVEYYNESIKKSVTTLEDKKFVYALSIAAQTELFFNDKNYYIISTKFCAAMA